VTTFTHFTDPYLPQIDSSSRFAAPSAYSDSIDDSFFEWNGALDGLDENDFSLLVRSVELVVQAASFSPERLQLALRISPESAAKMTTSLERLAVIAPGDAYASRRVLVGVRGLPVLLAKLLSGRQYLPGVRHSAEELRAAS
jgi:hypothetical protein